MATEITASLFEKNAKLFNKKGLRRRYSSFPQRISEYAKVVPLGLTTKFVFEVIVDKGSYKGLAELLSNDGLMLLGSNNTVFLNQILNDYDKAPEHYTRIKEAVEKIRLDLKNLEETNTEYQELENDDVRFYVYPYTDKINTLCDFVEQEKDKLLEYSKKEDITLVFNVKGHTNLVNGFYSFNFFDADSKDEEKIIDYASTLTVTTDIKDPSKVIIAAYYLAGIAENPEDLEMLNTHIFAENLIYNAD